jgi:deazaflavin-dependent oxidoreductase (nitroreductase family)
MADLTRYARRSTVKLITVGRSSGQPRSVTIWFVIADATRVHVQHSSAAPAHWYKNLLKVPDVELDFGDGPRRGRAVAVTEADEIAAIQRQFRGKYFLYRLFQWLGRGRVPMVAAIEVKD